ncbi:xylulokinase [Neptunicella sp. SCSIO 80796]|uniref:xylulokinase n=1 Tax=Neptunicella plasticusilytica TaxID=3117012 RepID=UPI003A4D3F1B
MYIGIDLGTSGVKTILMSDNGDILATTTCKLDVSIPKPLWSEQDPQHWWQGTVNCLDQLSQQQNLSTVKAIGLAGQMHGATLLDAGDKVLRPAILWNDGRSEKQCQQIEADVRTSKQITGNLVMPGFTAPKLLWVKQNEPDIFDKISKVLLPKDYLRLCLTGDYASDMSDSAGTSWLDVGKRQWSSEMLAATGLTNEQMPSLYEGSEITGYLLPELAQKWGMQKVAVVAGGGDNAAGAVGVGIVNPGQAMLSLGTSGVYFAVSEGYKSNPESAVHSFCHALPNSWHLMSVMLSAASCLDWFANNSGISDVGTLLADVELNTRIDDPSVPYFLPYLTGERTPHNNPNATASFFGMTSATNKTLLGQAVLQGVSMALADGMDALHAAGMQPDDISLIGGGARNAYWRQLLADVLGKPVSYRQGGEVGPALGAARLAQLAMNPGTSIADICPIPKLVESHQPNPQLADYYQQRRNTFRQLYSQTEQLFSP